MVYVTTIPLHPDIAPSDPKYLNTLDYIDTHGQIFLTEFASMLATLSTQPATAYQTIMLTQVYNCLAGKGVYTLLSQ